jgi:hypothetical protein
MMNIFKKLIKKLNPLIADNIDVTKLIETEYQIHNRIINTYLDELKDRVHHRVRYLIKNYIIEIFLILNIVKNFILLIGNFGAETHILLADHSFYLSGVRFYLKLIELSPFILAVYLHKLLYLSSNPKSFVWSQLFEMLRGNTKPEEIGFCISDGSVLKKFLCRSHLVFYLTNISMINTSIEIEKLKN